MTNPEQRIKDLESTLVVRDAQLTNALIDIPAITEFSRIGGRSEAVEDVCRRAGRAFTVTDGKLTPTHHAKGADSIHAFVKQLQTDAPHMFGEPSAARTSATRTHNGPNPWKRESFNLTKQGHIVRNDPSLAQRLQAEASQ